MTRKKSSGKMWGWVGTYLAWIIATLVVLLPIYWLFIVQARSRLSFRGPSLLKHLFAANLSALSNQTFRGNVKLDIIALE